MNETQLPREIHRAKCGQFAKITLEIAADYHCSKEVQLSWVEHYAKREFGARTDSTKAQMEIRAVPDCAEHLLLHLNFRPAEQELRFSLRDKHTICSEGRIAVNES